MKPAKISRFLFLAVLLSASRLQAKEPRPAIEATKEEMPEAIQIFSSKDLIDEEHKVYVGHFKAAVVAEQIQAELKKGSHEAWEGEFSMTLIDTSVDLFLCRGRYANVGLKSRDMGRYVKRGNTISLKSELSPDTPPDEYVVVKWGAQVSLVRPDRLISFCNSVNLGLGAIGPLKAGDDKKQPQGLPEVPEEYKKYLLKSEVRATVTQVGKSEVQKNIPGQFHDLEGPMLRVNRGSDDGLLRGIELIHFSDTFVVEACVVECGKTDARLVAYLVGNDADKNLRPRLILSSRFTPPMDLRHSLQSNSKSRNIFQM
jgi:hypothetical protein